MPWFAVFSLLGLSSMFSSAAMTSLQNRFNSRKQNAEEENALPLHSPIRNTPSSVWIFGYGSLLWKVDFPYQAKVVGHIKGYSRKFWQGSNDHRGFPGALGRVVTVVEEPLECTWGVAYKVDPRDVMDVMDYLNHREKCGYTTKELLFHPTQDMPPFRALVYMGTTNNPYFLGPALIEDIARQVIKSRGPSGCNMEYVFKLAQAMREIAPSVRDDHLFSLERQINKMVAERMRGSSTDPDDTDDIEDDGYDEQKNDDNCTCKLCDLIDKSTL